MIVGAGVVGCYLGKLIGDCEIWEKNKKIIEKPCSGLVSISGMKSFGIDYSNCVRNEIYGAKIFSDNENIEVTKKTPVAVVLDRLKFQKQLAQEAEEAGCKIVFGKKWEKQTGAYTFGADGAFSTVAKSCGVERRFIVTKQIRCILKKNVNPDLVQIHLGDFAPGFFGWLIPFDEKNVEIGLGCDKNLAQNFEKFVKRFSIENIKQVQFAPITVFDLSQRTVFGKTALVGDAAGQTKSTTGGGIIFGCSCAKELADAVLRNDLESYETGWKQKYGKDLEMHLQIRKFLNKMNHDELLRIVKKEKLEKFLSFYGNMDKPQSLVSEVLKRPALWKYGAKFLFTR
jgi:flavin-dependent dehydrogenase